MTLRLRDTMTRALVPIEPLDGERVRIYSCGPTVYRFAHVGNLRTFMLADLIRRAVLYHGIDVLQVQNITDVGHLRADDTGAEVDPMLVAAGVEGRPSAQIADAYESAFHADAALVNILPAHEFPRATEHIPEMLALAEQLEDRGHAYVSASGNLYYAVSTYPAYGALSGNSLDELRAGHRGDVEADKRDPADFALWKAAGADSGRELHWPSRWGEGFPGWHLECSAMALRHLGATFDIHTGGEDNVFPHHEDEIAQSAPIVGGPPARAWVHGAHLLMSGRKMSKSAGNFQRITELASVGLDPLAFRYLCLTARYARKLNFSDESLAAAGAGLSSLRAELAALGPAPAAGPWAPPAVLRAGASPDRPAGRASELTGHQRDDLAEIAPPPLMDRAGNPAAPLSEAGRAILDRFVAAIDDDLDMPAALRITRETLRATALSRDERRWLVLDFDFVLGLDLDRAVPRAGGAGGAASAGSAGGAGGEGGAGGHSRAGASPGVAGGSPGLAAHRSQTDVAAAADLPAEAVELLQQRARARADRNYAAADRLREALRDLGIEPIDRADGSSDWRRVT